MTDDRVIPLKPLRSPPGVGPLRARLDDPRVRSGGASGPLLIVTLTLTLTHVPLDQRETLTRLLQDGRPVTVTLTPVPRENPDPAKSNGNGPNRPAPGGGLPSPG
ncbi:MAG: hypothetical protein EA420_14465 [Candidatus Competibacteraceae bacterium]|nr:MAG: hypothetical protein EA420_14465 [Candidatus Competibacteraceae bacterium]